MINRIGLRLLKTALVCSAATGIAAQAQESSTAQAASQTSESAVAPAAAATQAEAAVESYDDIVVTAQLRAQKLQDVPVSISALNGEMLADKGVVSLDQLTAVVPGVRMSSFGNPNFVFIRGVGAGNNLATEQPVGTFVDGVYFGRDRAAKSQLFDVERVEVLKGPQVTLFGRNTIGGAFSIVTRNPGNEFGGYVQANYEALLGSPGVEGAVTLPVSDALRFRVSGRYQDSLRWVKNPGAGEAAGSPEQATGRIIMLVEPHESLDVRVKAEVSSLRGGLDPFELIRATPAFLAVVRGVDSNEDGVLNRRATGPGFLAGFNEAFNDVDTQNVSGTINWRLGGVTLTSITGYVNYEVDAIGDVDASALSFIQNAYQQKYEALSQELRITSQDDSTLEYVAGLYYADEDFSSDKGVSINLAAHPVVNAAIPGIFPRQVTRNQIFDQSSRIMSAFAQGSLHATDTLSITGGLRHVWSRKEVNEQSLFYSALGQRTPNPLYNALFPNLGLGVVHSDSGIVRKEQSLSGLARLEYRPRNGALLYVSYTRGEKAGGFDEDNARALPRANEFKPEKVNSYQGGMKLDVWKGILNVDLFYNEISDLQVASFDGVAGFQVTNAASAVSRGVDIELRQRIAEGLTIGLQGSYLDAYYKSYRGAPGVFPAATQDLSGKSLPFAPHWTGNASVHYERPVGDWTLSAQADLFYSSSYNATFNNDPALQQGSYAKLDLRIAAYNAKHDLEFSVLGRNLNKSTAISFGNPLPLAPLIGLNYFAYSDAPRTITFQVRKGF